MTFYRQWRCDKGYYLPIVNFTCILSHQQLGKQNTNIWLLGFSMLINKLMKMIHGNMRRKLLFGHQNLQGGGVNNNEDKNKKSIDIDTIISETTPDVLGISETTMFDPQKSVKEGYTWELKPECPRISVLVNSSLNYRRRRDLERDGIAAIWVELSPQNKKPILVCQLYREWRRITPESGKSGVPGTEKKEAQLERWIEFCQVWKKVVQSKQEFHILGDFNMNRNGWSQLKINNNSTPANPAHDLTGLHPKAKFNEQDLVDILYSEILSSGDVVQLI